jgi:signal transduction histidine kinase
VTASPLGPPGGQPAGGLEVIVDQTEARRVAEDKRKLEERVGRMQRLEAVATLAGGIAHDFNNILTYLYAYADIAEGMLEPSSPAKALMVRIRIVVSVTGTVARWVTSLGQPRQAKTRPTRSTAPRPPMRPRALSGEMGA